MQKLKIWAWWGSQWHIWIPCFLAQPTDLTIKIWIFSSEECDLSYSFNFCFSSIYHFDCFLISFQLTLEGNPLYFQKRHRVSTIQHLSPQAAFKGVSLSLFANNYKRCTSSIIILIGPQVKNVICSMISLYDVASNNLKRSLNFYN